MYVYIVRKHRRIRFGQDPVHYTEDFTVVGASTSKKEAKAIAAEKSQRSAAHYTVGRLTVKPAQEEVKP